MPLRDGMMVIVKPKMDVALGETGWVDGIPGRLVGIQASCNKEPCLQQKIPGLEGFQVFWLSHALTFSLQMWKLVQSMWKIWHVYSSQWSLIVSIFDIWIKIGIAAGRNDNSMALTMASWVIPQWFKPSHHQRQEYREAAQANLRKATTDVTRVPYEGGWKDEHDFLWFHTANVISNKKDAWFNILHIVHNLSINHNHPFSPIFIHNFMGDKIWFDLRSSKVRDSERRAAPWKAWWSQPENVSTDWYDLPWSNHLKCPLGFE